MTTEELDILLEKYYKGQCSPKELALVNALLDNYAAMSPNSLDEDQRREVLKILQQDFELKMSKISKTPPSSSGFLLRYRSLFIKWGMAAAVAGLVFGFYYLFQLGSNKNMEIPLTVNAEVRPGATSASLVLPNGKTVALDSTLSRSIKNIQVSPSGLFLVKNNGQKVNLERSAGLSIYSKLVTKRGQQAPEMRLADGTKVWLNAASSLRFPVNFHGATREVQLIGEAYFEVAKDAAHPFIVNAAGNEIKVFGTHFNVMAYNDEPAIYATLLEGAIQIKNEKGSKMLSPGEQGMVNKDREIRVEKVDVRLATAWMNGKLPMENMDVHAILREISRWYDVDIKYETEIPDQSFSGNLNKDVPLAHILAALKANGVNCQLRDRIIIISQ